jgi:hypothetical protein
MQRKHLFAMVLPVIAMIAIMPSVYADGGATHIVLGTGNCAMMDPTPGDNYGAPTLSGTLRDVVTPSGQENIVCKTTISGYNGPEVQFDGVNNNPNNVECSSAVGAGVSLDWHETVSASGKVTLTCHIAP